MRILDIDSDKSLENVTLFLTSAEARRLQSYIEDLLKSEASGDHIHLNDKEFRRELTVTLYSDDDLRGFDSRSIRLIQTGV